jgi:hypothetical protein
MAYPDSLLLMPFGMIELYRDGLAPAIELRRSGKLAGWNARQ